MSFSRNGELTFLENLYIHGKISRNAFSFYLPRLVINQYIKVKANNFFNFFTHKEISALNIVVKR